MIVAFAPQTGTGQLARVRHSQNQPIERRCKIADGGRNVMPTPATQPRDVMTPDQFKTEMIGLLPRLRRFALTLTRSGPDADDLLQDACTTALQKWQQYDPSQPFDRWMFRVIRNLWISEIRKRKVRQ
ncbi:MAG: sigma-70 family RNA polymerase sigma factor, partial [Pseudomonadota bacterium]